MKTLIDHRVTPVGGWRYVDPDTGYEYNRQYRSYKDLTNHIFKYRQMNNLPALHNVDATIFDWLCEQPNMEEQCCDIAVRNRTWKETFRGAKQTLKAATLGMFCPIDIAERRANRCLECSRNKFKKEDIKYYNTKLSSTMIHGRSVPNQDKLYTCSVCNCILAIKVHHTHREILENLDDELIEELKQVKDCWQIKDFK